MASTHIAAFESIIHFERRSMALLLQQETGDKRFHEN